MQPQEQTSAASAIFAWAGAELLSLMQLLFFLALGYLVTRTWFWSRDSTGKALAKKLEAMEASPGDVSPGGAGDGEESPPSAKSRNANARERKRTRKAKEVAPDETPEATVAEPPPEQLPEQPPAEAPEQPPAPAPERPAEQQEVPVEPAQEAPVSERVAKMMAKKMERKAKKAQEKLAVEEQLREEEERRQLAGGNAEDESDIVAIVEAKSEAEALSDDTAQTTSTPSMVNCTQNDEIPIETLPVVEVDLVVPEVETLPVAENVPVVESLGIKDETLCSQVMEDSLETDYVKSDSDDVCVHSSPEGISTPEQCLTPRGLDNAPIMWCGAPQSESPAASESVGFPQMIPQIEGWMAVAVPAEYAPPGHFDGLWKNGGGERIEIDHSEIKFEDGTQWAIQICSLTTFSVDVGGEEFRAELDASGQSLAWSDGDVWTCIGQTEIQRQWSASQDDAARVPCIPLMEGVPGEPLFPIDVMTPPPPLPKNMLIPEDAETWEVCWDWAKKGWCPRGDACDWYHPMQAPMPYCQPCAQDAPFRDGPFSEEHGAGMDYAVY